MCLTQDCEVCVHVHVDGDDELIEGEQHPYSHGE